MRMVCQARSNVCRRHGCFPPTVQDSCSRWGVPHHHTWVARLYIVVGRVAARRGAIVDYPEHTSCRAIRLLVYYVVDQSAERRLASLPLTATNNYGPMDVPG